VWFVSLPFDATLKELVQAYPRDWLAVLGLPATGPVIPLNVDLSTLSAAGDVVLGVGDPPELVVDLEFQSGRDPDLVNRLLLYHAALRHRYGVPVHTAVVLLRPAANVARMDGVLRYETQVGRAGLEFRFEVRRIWERPADELLQGTLGTLPLAPLGALPGGLGPMEALPAIIARIGERLRAEAPPAVAAKLMTAAYVLTGVRVTQDEVNRLYRGITMLEESTSYQYILKRGALERLRKLVLRLGRAKFAAEPDAAIVSRIEAVAEPDELDRLAERVLFVNSWAELIAGS
jgi:predicted transposase YdaD